MGTAESYEVGATGKGNRYKRQLPGEVGPRGILRTIASTISPATGQRSPLLTGVRAKVPSLRSGGVFDRSRTSVTSILNNPSQALKVPGAVHACGHHAEIGAIAVTQGPGLAIALEVGIRKTKELSQTYKKPIIAVNHMEGHILANFAKNSNYSVVFVK